MHGGSCVQTAFYLFRIVELQLTTLTSSYIFIYEHMLIYRRGWSLWVIIIVENIIIVITLKIMVMVITQIKVRGTITITVKATVTAIAIVIVTDIAIHMAQTRRLCLFRSLLLQSI